jgi:predicted phosphodiesterase
MNQKEYKGIDDIIFIGDCHTNITDPIDNQLITNKVRNTLLIFAGDAGVGFKQFPNPAKIKVLNRRLKAANCYAVIVRGNHDDPDKFRQHRDNMKWQLPNFTTIDDYTILDVNGPNKHATILCIGGGISRDRLVRRDGKDWWHDEPVVVNQVVLDQLADSEAKIDCVVTHDAPAEFYPSPNEFTDSWWELNDLTLKEDCKASRDKLSYIMKELVDNKVIAREYEPPTWWVYGHFHRSKTEEVGNIRRVLLDSREPYPYLPYNFNEQFSGDDKDRVIS